MAAAAPIALALQVGGQLMGGVEQSNALTEQARAKTENARRTVLQGEQDTLQIRRQERESSGDLIAALGGTGLAIGGGSNGDVIAAAAYNRELDILNLRRQAVGEGNTLLRSASDDRKQARSAIVRSVFGAAATALGGLGDMNAAKGQSAIRRTERGAMRTGSVRVPTRTVFNGGG